MPFRPGLILQHSAAGTLGRLGEWLRQRSIPYQVMKAWESVDVPDPEDHRFVVSLGSRHSVSESDVPWVSNELRFLRRSVEADVPVLGLCFGGQALATVLGGGVQRMARPEVGWAKIRSEAEWLVPGPWLQYHMEVLVLPDGASRLAHDHAGPAAFAAGPHIGVQFHPEVTSDMLDAWARMDTELPTGVTPEELATQSRQHAARAREAAFDLFDAWWGRGPAQDHASARPDECS